ncbi:unnamed protein product [Paramecium primaurelia]|uniref:Transmembrane protein n=1 Tax=Paramecium primaurelia TaxID=5886 RepID=A0A8S1LRX7_PARPR|nr:unnamed protein product [Paramecium primaurelia]
MFGIIKYSLLFLIICGITIIRDRELAENELEYYKQMNYGLWTILIPFLVLLLPIFSQKTRNKYDEDISENLNTKNEELEKPNISQNKNNQDHNLMKKEEFVQTDFGTDYFCEMATQENKGDINGRGQDQIYTDFNQNILTDHYEDNDKLQIENSQELLFQQKSEQMIIDEKQNDDLILNNLSDISHKNMLSCNDTERESVNITQNSKIFHTYSNSYQIKDFNQSQEQNQEKLLKISKILEIIDAVPVIVLKKYEEFVTNNRKERRDLIYKDFDTFTDIDAQNYIKLLKNLFKFHDNLIRKGQKYYILKNKMDYKHFIKSFNKYLLDPLASNEILSHQRFALQQLKFSLQNSQVLLQYQVLEIYQILINLMSNPTEILNKVFSQFNNKSESLYLNSILQYFLEDYVYYHKKIEDEDFQRYLKIYHNCNEIINLQYSLDEKMNQYIFQQQRLLNLN